MMRLTCEWCQKRFVRPGSRGPIPKFCSASHRQRAWELRMLQRRIDDAVAAALGKKKR